MSDHVMPAGELVLHGGRFDGRHHVFHVVMSYGAAAEVLAASELRGRIAAAAAETAALYAAAV